jgi:hypothetical protein
MVCHPIPKIAPTAFGVHAELETVKDPVPRIVDGGLKKQIVGWMVNQWTATQHIELIDFQHSKKHL